MTQGKSPAEPIATYAEAHPVARAPQLPRRETARVASNVYSTPMPLEGTPTLAPDLLRGADQIAAFLYGSTTERKKVYHLVQTARLPVFRLGCLLCARRSVLLAWIEEQETRGRKGR